MEATIWKPVGKQPSSLWKGELANCNGLFLALYEHFKTHESYTFVYQPEWETSGDICHDYGNIALNRIGKWLAYFGLVEHNLGRTQSNKLEHTLKPTSAGWLICDKGGVYTFGMSYSPNEVCGLGKKYPVFKELEQAISRKYVENNVAYWRQAKWATEWKTLYNSHLSKEAGEMKLMIMSWLAEKIASIRLKRKAKAREIAKVLVETGVTKALTEFCER